MNSSSVVYTCDYAPIEKLMTKTTMLICDAETNIGVDRAFFVPVRFCDLDIEYKDVEIISRTDSEITVKAKTFTPFVMLDEEKMVIEARLKAMYELTARDHELGDFTEKEAFYMLEKEYRAFTRFYNKQWKKTKKRIRKESLSWENIKKNNNND